MICDGEEAIFESKDGKENDYINMFFYFRFRLVLQNSKVQCNLHVRIDLIVFYILKVRARFKSAFSRADLDF